MKGSKKPGIGRHYGSAAKGVWVRRDAATGRFHNTKRHAHLVKGARRNDGLIVEVRVPKVFAGPSVEGKGLRLVEVVSGNVEDRRPSFA